MMKKRYFFTLLFFWCTQVFTASPTNLNEKSFSLRLIAVGSYENTDTNQVPLIYQSSFIGNSFTPKPTTLPTDYHNFATLEGGARSFLKSFGVGLYVDTNQDTKPLITFSNNAGFSWNFVSAPLPAGYDSLAVLSKADCYFNDCVAVGIYSDGILPIKPYIIKSTDGGASWSLASYTLPADFLNFGTISAIDCDKDLCVAAGSYIKAGNIRVPLLLVSNDKGATFASVTPTLPPTFVDQGGIESIDCKNSTCIGVGGFSAGFFFQTEPLILT